MGGRGEEAVEGGEGGAVEVAEVSKEEEEVAQVEEPKVEVVGGQLRPQRTVAISSTLRTVRTRALVVAMAAGAREEAMVVRAVARAVARRGGGGLQLRPRRTAPVSSILRTMRTTALVVVGRRREEAPESEQAPSV